MNVRDLTRDQKIELKQSMLEEVLGYEPSWGDITDADSIVSDEKMIEEYDGTNFSNNDFSCSPF